MAARLQFKEHFILSLNYIASNALTEIEILKRRHKPKENTIKEIDGSNLKEKLIVMPTIANAFNQL